MGGAVPVRGLYSASAIARQGLWTTFFIVFICCLILYQSNHYAPELHRAAGVDLVGVGEGELAVGSDPEG